MIEQVQKFHRGDWVKVAQDSCFKLVAGFEAIIEYSGNEFLRNGDTENYSLLLKGGSSVAGCHEKDLTLIESGRWDKLQEWSKEEENVCSTN